MTFSTTKSVVLIVAHPDDETLWAGGTILSHPTWKCFVVCLCRGSDTNRVTKFLEALKILNAGGIMGDLDDGPEQNPLNEVIVENAILQLLPTNHFDLVITHHSTGEYTRHLRHEETNKAVIALWRRGKIKTKELWTFAYEDGNKRYFPRPIGIADIFQKLSEKTWVKKYDIILKTYGYDKNSWETKTTPMSEAFWQYKNAWDAKLTVHPINNDIKISKIMIIKNLIRKW